MESYSRIRSVKLKRPSPELSFGFAVRGGFEHGTGIFVSSVCPKSIAFRQGLKVGDQILRVNGYPVSVAIHQECLALMRIRSSLHLKVRSVGMLPVKEKQDEPLTWRLVEECSISNEEENHNNFGGSVIQIPNHHHHHHYRHHHHHSQNSIVNNHHPPIVSTMSDTSSQPDSRTDFIGQEAKIYINTVGHSGLGCCICKGPPERPGIFVQSTKSNGVAREAGLRPGDQILQCNGYSFLNIPFAEAVSHLKSSRQLNLTVIKGIASDLFPGESSGYNSSASSLNGETITTQLSVGSGTRSSSTASSSPSSEIVVQQYDNGKNDPETSDIRSSIEARYGHHVEVDRNIEWDEIEQVWHSPEKESIIISVNGEDLSTKLKSEEVRLLEERKKLEEEQKRLQEEAIRLREEKRQFEEEKRKTHQKSDSVGSSSSSTCSTNQQNSRKNLAGALNDEILKRNERRENKVHQETSVAEPTDKNDMEAKNKPNGPFTGPIDDAKRQQHEQLIEEFKRAHRKMFAQTLEEENTCLDKNPPREERASFRVKRFQKEVEHARKMIEQKVAGIVKQRQLRIERQHQEVQETEREVFKIRKSPPPPPPDSVVLETSKSKGNPNRIQQHCRKLPTSSVQKNEKPQNSTVNPPLQKQVSTSTTRTPKEESRLLSIISPNVMEERPPSPSPDYSNSPSPETTRKTFGFSNKNSSPATRKTKTPKQNEVIAQRELGNAMSCIQISPTYNNKPTLENDQIVRNKNGQVTIHVEGNATGSSGNHGVQKMNGKTHGGILKNATTMIHTESRPELGTTTGNLKSISFGHFY